MIDMWWVLYIKWYTAHNKNTNVNVWNEMIYVIKIVSYDFML